MSNETEQIAKELKIKLEEAELIKKIRKERQLQEDINKRYRENLNKLRSTRIKIETKYESEGKLVFPDDSIIAETFGDALETMTDIKIGDIYTITKEDKGIECYEVIQADCWDTVKRSKRVTPKILDTITNTWRLATESECKNWKNISKDRKRIDWLVGIISDT